MVTVAVDGGDGKNPLGCLQKSGERNRGGGGLEWRRTARVGAQGRGFKGEGREQVRRTSTMGGSRSLRDWREERRQEELLLTDIYLG
jgi:hypothetical protein